MQSALRRFSSKAPRSTPAFAPPRVRGWFNLRGARACGNPFPSAAGPRELQTAPARRCAHPGRARRLGPARPSFMRGRREGPEARPAWGRRADRKARPRACGVNPVVQRRSLDARARCCACLGAGWRRPLCVWAALRGRQEVHLETGPGGLIRGVGGQL